jgi:dCTP deaminase
VSILSGPEIRRLAEATGPLNGKRIVIEPFDPALCGPCSYDVHLGGELREYVGNHGKAIDPIDPPPTAVVPLGLGGAWRLEPNRVYLAATREYTETAGLVPVLYGRSSIGRLGLFIHVTAGYGDDGFKGHWTLELVATQPILVRPGMRIGQLIYHTLVGERQEYAGRYQQQSATPVASRYHLPGGVK